MTLILTAANLNNFTLVADRQVSWQGKARSGSLDKIFGLALRELEHQGKIRGDDTEYYLLVDA